LPVLTVAYDGFVNHDNASSLAVQPKATTTATVSSAPGQYPITAAGGSDPDYSFTYTPGTLSIGMSALTVTANPQTKVYGAADPALTYAVTGFRNGDNSSLLTGSLSRVAGENVGRYAITQGSLSAGGGYTINFTGNTLVINQAALKITANDVSMPYGGPVPALTVSYSGFVNNDNASSLTTQPTVITTATAYSEPGTYPITVFGALDPNYTISYAPGTLTVGASTPTLHVTANAQTKEYGAADPAFTYTVTGFSNGDNASVLTGSLSRAAGENVGRYAITKGSLSAGSGYRIDFTGNYLTITQAAQHISWGQSLSVGCNSSTQVQLTATASSGLPVSYSVSNTNVATVSGNVLTLLHPGTAVVTATQGGDANFAVAQAVTDTIFYQPASLVQQHFDDALYFDNSSGNYVQWQWYKNGDAVAGADNPYYSETPALNGQYFVIATNKTGQHVQSCTLSITGGGVVTTGIKVSPNPAHAGELVTVISNYVSAVLQGAILQIVDINGRVRQQITSVQPSTQVTMPSDPGIYIINLLLASGQRASTNVLVAN
jgi:hypothetical protein